MLGYEEIVYPLLSHINVAGKLVKLPKPIKPNPEFGIKKVGEVVEED